jgi:hypothetical protein
VGTFKLKYKSFAMAKCEVDSCQCPLSKTESALYSSIKIGNHANTNSVACTTDILL